MEKTSLGGHLRCPPLLNSKHKNIKGKIMTKKTNDALIKLPENQAVMQDEAFKSLQSGTYLSRLQLMTSNSKQCKAGAFPVNHYATISQGNYKDVGKELDALVITWHPKAIEMGDEAVVSTFDSESDLFKDIQERSEVADSGCMWGFEYLLYLPDTQEFTTFFFGSKSARREAPNMQAQLQKAATISSKLIETKKYSWQAPKITACSTPFDLPTQEEIAENIEKFNKEPEAPELAEDEASERQR